MIPGVDEAPEIKEVDVDTYEELHDKYDTIDVDIEQYE